MYLDANNINIQLQYRYMSAASALKAGVTAQSHWIKPLNAAKQALTAKRPSNANRLYTCPPSQPTIH